MKRKDLIEWLSSPYYNDEDEVVIEFQGSDYHISEVYKDGKGDICIREGEEI